ncbi:hypothetical protein [Williamsia sp. CHRR-6]|uniref:hypothetical protein n=1 Tax=Williamsia sp. CHRR-6 TaxID=2835871 RepID=UPI001BD96ADD|nr:hypothetical protein [Williamsia sp. CHRR-6]MBT0566265.1 hypothetical protein [Williamsia sp. CHRR-6]
MSTSKEAEQAAGVAVDRGAIQFHVSTTRSEWKEHYLMGEKLEVSPGELYGAGAYVRVLGDNTKAAADMVRTSAAPNSDDFRGLMLILKNPAQVLSENTATRFTDLATQLSSTGFHLEQAAWNYQVQDRTNAAGLAHTISAKDYGPAQVTEVPNAISYGQPQTVDTTAPASHPDDLRSLIDSTMGYLADVDSKIKEITQYSLIESAIEPLAGNWNGLKTIGDAYEKGGNALESSGNDLTSSSSRLDPTWDGSAAIAYGEYSSNLARGLVWEGAAGRLLKQGLYLAAEKIAEAVKAVLEYVKRALEQFVDFGSVKGTVKTLAKQFPVFGQAYTVYKVEELVQELVSTAMKIYDDTVKTVEAVQEFLDFAKDPIGYVKQSAEDQIQQRINEKVGPYKDALDKGKQTVDNARDLATVADSRGITDRPNAAYDAGNQWDDAR